MKILAETSIGLFIVSIYICLCGCSSDKKASPPDNMTSMDDKEILCTIADNLCKKADLKFIDTTIRNYYFEEENKNEQAK